MDFLAGILVGSGATILMWRLLSDRFERTIGSHIAGREPLRQVGAIGR